MSFIAYFHSLLYFSLLSLSYSFLTSSPIANHQFMPSLSHSSSSRREVFSGIIEEMGTVKSMELKDEMEMWDGSKASGYELTIKNVNVALSDGSAYDGCSIAVNGVCLTVKTFTETLDGKNRKIIRMRIN